MHIRTKKRPERYRLQFDSHQQGHQKGVQLMTCPDISHGGICQEAKARGDAVISVGVVAKGTTTLYSVKYDPPASHNSGAIHYLSRVSARYARSRKKGKKKWRPALCGAMKPQRRDPHKARENAGKDGVSRGHMRGTSSGVL